MRVDGGGGRWRVRVGVEGGERRDDVGIYGSSTYYCHS